MRQAIYEILAMSWEVMGIYKMVQALQRRTCLVNHVQVYWIIQGDQRCAFFPNGTNNEIELTLVPRGVWSVGHNEGTRPVAVGFW